MNEIVTGDETWVYFYEPDGKEKNKVWVSENDERPRIASRACTSKRIMYALFFDCQGNWWLQFLYQKAGVLPESFIEIQFFLLLLVTILQPVPVRGIKLLHDNTPAHK
jgi:histone-lysine N-methyltransferase SETMAR